MLQIETLLTRALRFFGALHLEASVAWCFYIASRRGHGFTAEGGFPLVPSARDQSTLGQISAETFSRVVLLAPFVREHTLSFELQKATSKELDTT